MKGQVMVSKKDFEDFETSRNARKKELLNMFILDYDNDDYIKPFDVFLFLLFGFIKVPQVFNMTKAQFKKRIRGNKRLIKITERMVKNEPLNWIEE